LLCTHYSEGFETRRTVKDASEKKEKRKKLNNNKKTKTTKHEFLAGNTLLNVDLLHLKVAQGRILFHVCRLDRQRRILRSDVQKTREKTKKKYISLTCNKIDRNRKK
jgi:hypothetical protein